MLVRNRHNNQTLSFDEYERLLTEDKNGVIDIDSPFTQKELSIEEKLAKITEEDLGTSMFSKTKGFSTGY